MKSRIGSKPAARGLATSGAIAILLAALIVACGGGGGGASSAEIAQGQDLFRQTCATCHGADARGMPKLGKDLHGNAFVKGLSDEELVEFLRVGRPAFHPLNERGVDMPPRGGNPTLKDADLALIAAYMRSIS